MERSSSRARWTWCTAAAAVAALVSLSAPAHAEAAAPDCRRVCVVGHAYAMLTGEISGDGRFVAYTNDDPRAFFIWDLRTGAVSRVGTGNGMGSGALFSGTDRYVAFSSGATNLVPGDSNGF